MIYKNKKKGTLYKIRGTAINCTNAQDGQEMFLYEPLEQTGGHLTFVREKNEFYEKFELIEN